MPKINRIREFREARELTQRRLAAMARTSQQQIQRIESGAQNPRFDLALRICGVLGAKMEEIFPEIERETVAFRGRNRGGPRRYGNQPVGELEAGTEFLTNIAEKTMAAETLTPLLWKLSQPLLVAVAKRGLKLLLEDPPLSRAIRATVDAFPGIENLEQALRTWCSSEDFLDLLRRLQRGERGLTDAVVIDSFLRHSDFYAADNTVSVGQEIVATLFQKLAEEFHGDGTGLLFHAQREEVLHAQTQELVVDVGQDITRSLAELRQLVTQRLPSDEIGSEVKVREQMFHAKIDEARDLLKEGRASAGRSILIRLRRDPMAHSFSDELQFRLATNIGACALRLGNEEEGIAEFRDALRYQPENPKALGNAALAELLAGNLEQAISLSMEARVRSPRDSQATSMYLQALHRAGRDAEVERLQVEESWIEEDAVCTLALGSMEFRDKDYAAAEKWLRVSRDKDPSNPETYSLLAQAIVVPLQSALLNTPPLPGLLPKNVVDRASDAKGFLTTAIEILENQENCPNLWTALVNRAAIQILLGNFDDAINDCDRVLAVESTDATALRNKSVALLQVGRAQEAIGCLERISELEERSKIPLMLAAAYWETGSFERAVAVLAPTWNPDSPKREQIEIADLLASSYMMLGKSDNADQIVHKLIELWPGDPDALRVVAHHRRNQGRPEEAIALLREALSYAKDGRRESVASDLADSYFFQGRYAEAAEMYAPLVNRSKDTPSTRRYLISLFNTGSYKEALTLARAIRGEGAAIPIITEIEALIVEHVDDLEGARLLRRQLTEAEPKNVSHRVHLALLDIRTGDRERAREVVGSIRFDEMKDDAKALVQVAEARLMLEMGHVLPLAYRARRLAFGDPDVHLAYLHLFLRREDADRESLEPAAIGADCTVQLKRNNETRRFTILGEESVDGDRGELRIDDSLARKLLGKRKGDLVRVKDTPLEQVEYEIVEVQSKYVAAFQETMSGFSTWFPDHPALHRVDVRDGDFSKMTMLLDARQKRIFEVMRLYRDGRITLGAFAGMVGSDLTELWAGMISRPDGIVMAATGTVEDIRRDAKHVGNAKELVFDLTALLTLAYLGLLERVAAAMERVIVPQAVLDDLNEKLANDFVGPRPSMTVWKEGDRYLRHETTPEALERGRQFLRGIRSFIETHAELAPAEGVLEFDQTKIKELQQILGRSATAAILVARSRGTLLYSDDLGLRAVARNDWQVEGCWTQAILARLHESSAISEDEYHEAVVKLAIGNYHFVSINSGDLLWVLRRDDLKASHTVAHMLGLLGGPECSEETAVPIVADCIRAVWLENILFDEKLAILDLAMACLTKGRMVGGIVERLKAALRTRFALFPLAIPVIFRSIDLWASQRLLEGGRFQSRSIS